MHTRLYSPHEIVSLGSLAGLKATKLTDKHGNTYNPSTGRYWIELTKLQ